jgi:hypothetical protein
MPWVMVPVPEELAADVERLTFQLRYRDTMMRWTPALMRDHLLSLADEPRVALLTVAARVVAGDPIDDVGLADHLGITVREVFGVVRDANDVTVAALVGDLIGARQVPIKGDAGGTRRVLNMLPLHAQMVRDEQVSLGLRHAIAPAD